MSDWWKHTHVHNVGWWCAVWWMSACVKHTHTHTEQTSCSSGESSASAALSCEAVAILDLIVWIRAIARFTTAPVLLAWSKLGMALLNDSRKRAVDSRASTTRTREPSLRRRRSACA